MRTVPALALFSLLLLLVAAPGLTSAQLLISEVYFCHPGGDDGYEWVEIVNLTESAIDLSDYVLAGGGLDYTWTTVALSGILSGCGTFVVGGPFTIPMNGSPAYDQIENLDQDLQNGGLIADGVALFLATADVTTDAPIDAVIYGQTNVNGLWDETGGPGGVDVASAPAGQSIERQSTNPEWIINTAPDPNGVVFTSATGDCAAIPSSPSSWGAVKAAFR